MRSLAPEPCVHRQRHAKIPRRQPRTDRFPASSRPCAACAPCVARPGARPRHHDGLARLQEVDTEIVWHNGGTGGYRSFAGFDPAKKTGCRRALQYLARQRRPRPPHPRGEISRGPASRPPKERKEITLDPKLLDAYAGEYPLAPTFIIKVTAEAASTSTPRLPPNRASNCSPKRKMKFFLKVVDAQ